METKVSSDRTPAVETKTDTQKSLNERASQQYYRRQRQLSTLIEEIRGRLREIGDSVTATEFEDSQSAWTMYLKKAEVLGAWSARSGSLAPTLSATVGERVIFARIEELQLVFGDLLSTVPNTPPN